MTAITQQYEIYYSATVGGIYPTEWLIRTFKGRYAGLKFKTSEISGGKLLELGFGDGRNMPLFEDCGLSISGTEISDKICQVAAAKLAPFGISPDLRTGFNDAIPFEDSTFDCVVACHSFYYIRPGTTFADNIAEACRVLKPQGWFIASLIDPECYLIENAKPLGGGLYECQNDPYGVRKGELFQAFENEKQIEDAFAKQFRNFSFGHQFCDFYGLKTNYYLVVCQKRD